MCCMSEISILGASLDTVWITICAIIVFFMQAGFAMLEGGLVRSKNTVNVIMKNYVDMSIGSLGFFIVGFGLMFGTNPTGFFGTSLFAPQFTDGSGYSFLFFQMMFAATSATIVSGALAERIRYYPYVMAALVISAFIYPVFGSWVWGGYGSQTMGWLASLGYIDFAGSSVVHAVGGWCALAGVVVLGPRSGRFGRRRGAIHARAQHHPIPGHNLPMAALGAFILWFGFFAFNTGSTLSAGGSLGQIALNTHLSGSAGVLGSVLLVNLVKRPLLLAYPINGGLGGLVAICAGANAVSPLSAILIGFVAGFVVVLGMELLEKLELDDAVGAVPVHAFAGSWGVLAVAIFHQERFFDLTQISVQAVGMMVAFLWAFSVSWIVFRLIGFMTDLRVSIKDERRGLDYSEHYELGYPEFQDEMLHQGKGQSLPQGSSQPVPGSALR